MTAKSETQHCVMFFTSKRGNATPDYIYGLAKEAAKAGYFAIIVLDQKQEDVCEENKIKFYSWPSIRPKKFADFLFIRQLFIKYRPVAVIPNFGAITLVLIASWLFNIPNRLPFHRTLYKQLVTDNKSSPLNLRLKILFRTCILRLATKILANSKGSKYDLIKYYAARESKITILYNLLKAPEIEPALAVTRIRSKRMACIGRLDKSKGQEIIINALPAILAEHPKATLYLIGSGIQHRALELLVAELGLQKNVIFTGTLSREALFELLNTTSIHISASLDEAFGWVNIEALSLGIPILGPNVGGISEIIQPAINGYFIERTQEDIANHVKKLWENEDAYYHLSNQAKTSFTERFSLSHHLPKHWTTLHQIIHTRANHKK